MTVDGSVGELSDGIQQLKKEGTEPLAEGAAQLDEGAAQLEKGAGQLASGTGMLSGGTTELLSGVNKLAYGTSAAEKGAWQLANGMNRFNKEGIQAFVGALSESGLAGVASRFGQLCEADRADVFYGGKLATATGDSRIVFKTGAVKAKEESKSSSKSKSKTTSKNDSKKAD
jgi:putative membrane protein